MGFEAGSQTLSLKVYIDKENNRVVMAEADADFVDILLSFLTLPMGTIVRLINKPPQPATLGSLTALYKWVEEELEEQFLQTESCKSMLLHPRNPNEKVCNKLKINIDDTEPIKYYICADWNCSRGKYHGGPGSLYSTFKTVRCNCGKMMDKEICMAKEDQEAAGSEGDGEVFVCGTTKFMVTDDLQVQPISPFTIAAQLLELGFKDTSSLQETTLSIGSEEILNLLKGSLFSNTPLTDVLLRKQGFTSETQKFEIRDAVQSKSSGSTLFISPQLSLMTMKLMMRKSMNKALYAEAGEDIVNFLLSFLTMPLGSILRLLGGNSSLGSIDNLYKSVKCSRVTKNDSLRDLLLHSAGPCHGSYNPLGVNETHCVEPFLWCTSYEDPENEADDLYTGYLTTMHQPNRGRRNENGLYLKNKSPLIGTASQVGFLKRPANFMLTDNLVFKPLVSSSNLSLSFLKQETETTLDDLEIREIKVGRKQALRLLKAYLLLKSVPIDAWPGIVYFDLKSPRQGK